MNHAGVVVVWSRGGPRLDAYRIPLGYEGFVLGRKQYADDDRMSPAHAIFRKERDTMTVTVGGAGSRSVTRVNARDLGDRTVRPRLPAIVRTGHTVSVVVADVRPHEHVEIARRDKLVVAGSLANTLRALDQAANDEENVVLLGTTGVGRLLARDYASKLGDFVESYLYMPAADGTFGKHVEGKRARTIILVLSRPLTLPDLPELEQWLETDTRIVSIARDLDAFKFTPDHIKRRLAARVIDLPALRFDELPTVLFERARKQKPKIMLHASFVEMALVRARELDEDAMFSDVDTTIADWDDDAPIRGDALAAEIDSRSAVHAVAPGLPRLGWAERVGD